MNFNIKKALINFARAYIAVTVLAYGVSFLAAFIFKLPSYDELGVSLFEDPAFVMTVPYHLLINLVCWTLFSYFYFRKKEKNSSFLKETLLLGFFWLVVALTVDLVGFVLIKSPLQLTPHQFYVEYQPWISITYLIVLGSPLIYYSMYKIRNK